MPNYEKDQFGNQVMRHESGKWFAYAFGTYKTECLRGKGYTKEAAIQNSIDNTEKD